MRIVLVHIFDHAIHASIVVEGIGILEIHAEENKHLARRVDCVVFSKVHEKSVEFLTFSYSIEGVVLLFVCLKNGVLASDVKVESAGEDVDVGEHVHQNAIVSSKAISAHRLLNPFHLSRVHPDVLLCSVHPAEEHGVKAHLVEESSISIRMTKWVYLPANTWLSSKFFESKLLPVHHIVYHILVDRTRLIMHRPTSINNLKLSILHKPSYLILLLVRLEHPPHREKLHLNLREFTFRIVDQRIHNSR